MEEVSYKEVQSYVKDLAEKVKKRLFQAFKAEGVLIVQSFTASVRGEIIQIVEDAQVPDSTDPLGWKLERQHRLEVPKFSDINQMRQAFILAYHLGIYKVEQEVKEVKGEWKRWQLERNRYKKAWSFALQWMQDAYGEALKLAPSDALKIVEMELKAAKACTKPPSKIIQFGNQLAKVMVVWLLKPLLLLYMWSAIAWILIANQVPPFHLISADQGLADLQQPGVFSAIIQLVFCLMGLYYMFKYLLKELREEGHFIGEATMKERTAIFEESSK
ncbi:hypothetical protein J26TS2_44810 [Shouchella clausii]|nr:hypothetical protein J26TS2_44810 [Shouchella clausii]